MKPFDPTKPVQTRDGRKARILATDRRSAQYPIVALVINEPGDVETVRVYTAEGLLFASSEKTDVDLLNIPETEKIDVVLFYNSALRSFYALDASSPIAYSQYTEVGRITVEVPV